MKRCRCRVLLVLVAVLASIIAGLVVGILIASRDGNVITAVLSGGGTFLIAVPVALLIMRDAGAFKDDHSTP